jgi:phage terminase large subunit-like protein
MAAPVVHWETATRTERLVRLLVRSFTPVRYPTIAIAAFFAATSYAKACVVTRGLTARDEHELLVRLRATSELNIPAVLLPYLYLKNSHQDAFYMEEGEPWAEESATAIAAELERLRQALEPLRGT